MNDKVKVVIVDDERLARDILKNYIREHDNVELIAECTNGFEGVKSINDLKPDLVFLDIQMPKITGFEMLELLETTPQIIFTTAYDQYALKAFEVNATDYLLKPFAYDRFDEALAKAIDKMADRGKSKEAIEKLVNHKDQSDEKLDRVVVKSGQKITVIPVEDLQYLEAQDDYVMLHTKQGNHLKQKTMKYFEEHLQANKFIRVHRSYIVNLNEIEELYLHEKETYRALLKCGDKIPVSKSGYSNLKEFLK
ncbi:MAG: LytTR family transcriptional regulator DNA-binding domain-containing protein [Melioribacteraceae bacterium]|nr:LytTR family transcriptional regulator DNA-binding domain-containing protein [Melioribacteraceae bacterium]MCF8356493.1 LytTR family transcriptional regulator DNA-binding domain-containing protein [Melioribacteraceae bacterium]MCF8394854.1 LytTR family transcriptional regulator DNA-binding domain-containing protein [Melioribacteraceae bacterium]MCF8420582.1 LytTR family transcriptional regulator DNA-binding domain-containing protein [Melioribacteraceae bacterium]